MERPEGGFPLGRDLDAELRRVKWEVSSESGGRERAGTREHDTDWNIFQPGGDPACSGRIAFTHQMRLAIKAIRKNGRIVRLARLVPGCLPNFAQYAPRLSLMVGDPLGRTHDRKRPRR